MKRAWILIFLVANVFAQTNLGPINTPLFNSIPYVGIGGYASITAAIASQAGNCGIIKVGPGTFFDNVTITPSTCTNNKMPTIQCNGRRSTLLKPLLNAPVITIDSSAGPLQGFKIEDCGFDATGTSTTSPAILITSSNAAAINDLHEFRRLFIYGPFSNDIQIVRRCIWCDFIEVEADNATGDGFNFISDSLGAINAVHLQNVLIQSSGGRCMYFQSDATALDDLLEINDTTFQLCAKEGLVVNNIQGMTIKGSDFESNGTSGTYDNISITGTWARGFHIVDNSLLGSTTGAGIEVAATNVSGVIAGNLISTPTGQNTIKIDNAVGAGNVSIGPNWEASTLTPAHFIGSDVNGVYHASDYGSALAFGPSGYSQVGTQTINVQGISNLYLTNASALTIPNFTGADPGQIVTVFQGSASTTTFNFSNTNGFYVPSNYAVTIGAGQTVSWIYSPYNGRWLLLQNVSPPLVATGTATLTSSSIAAVTCAAVVTVAATGTATTDKISWSYASAPSTATDGKLILSVYPTLNNVNFLLCNPTAGALVPTGLVVNWNDSH